MSASTAPEVSPTAMRLACTVSVPPPSTPWPRNAAPSSTTWPLPLLKPSASSVTLPPLPPCCFALAKSPAPEDTSTRLPLPSTTSPVLRTDTLPPLRYARPPASSGFFSTLAQRPLVSSLAPPASTTVARPSAGGLM